MERSKTIADASVLVKWFVSEEGTRESLQLRENHLNENILLVVPDLAFIETINALRYKGWSETALAEANTALWDIDLQVERLTPNLLEKAIAISKKHDLSMYDSIYLALSTLLGAPLITSDKTLAKAPTAKLLKS